VAISATARDCTKSVTATPLESKVLLRCSVLSRPQPVLTDEERTGIILAVQSAFTKLKNLYRGIVPIFQSYGFTPSSPGVIARDLSKKI
jgi:hypothetical protein